MTRAPLGRPLASLVLAGVVGAACTGASLPGPRPAPAPLDPAATPPRPGAPARWVVTGGATLVGPTVAGGTLVLLGGRRAILDEAGALHPETAPAPEPLLELVRAPPASVASPSAAGGSAALAGPRLVGRGRHGVYRFDDPLGAPVKLAWSPGGVDRVGTAPGAVAVWIHGSVRPRLLDVETGEPAALPRLPPLPLRALAFRDGREGAAIFAGAGLAVTSDGGATFRQADDRGTGEALGASVLHVEGGLVRASRAELGPAGVVDIAAARLDPVEPRAAIDEPARGAHGEPPHGAPDQPARGVRDEPPLLRWIRVTGRDPLEAATTGVDAPGRGAIVASHGLLARIDPATGNVLELVELARGDRPTDCSIARTGALAFVACGLPAERGGPALFDPFGLLEVALAGPQLVIGPPLLVRNGAGALLVSTSGAVMLTGPCAGAQEDEGQACVRQPSGKWVTVKAATGPLRLTERGVGPLSGGRVAILRALAPEVDPPYPGDEASGSLQPYVAVVDAAGKESPFAPPFWTRPLKAPLRVESPIEEDGDHTLHFVIAEGSAAYVIAQPPGREAGAPVPVPGALAARLRGGRGIAVATTGVLASLDAGISWTEVAAPAAAVMGGGDDALAAGEVGAQVGSALRLGWDPAPAPAGAGAQGAPIVWPGPPVPAAPPAGSTPASDAAVPAPSASAAPASGSPAPTSEGDPLVVLAPEGRPAGPVLECHSSGPARPASNASAAAPQPLPPRWRVEQDRLARVRPFDVAARIEVSGSALPGAPPDAWTLTWDDPTEIGDAPHRWSGPAPRGARWGATLRAASAHGGSALFLVGGPGSSLLVRVSAEGKLQPIEAPVAPGAIGTFTVAFGEGKDPPLAWTSEGTVLLWPAGERLRELRAAGPGPLVLGRPDGGRLPVLLDAGLSLGDDAFRWLPLPAAGSVVSGARGGGPSAVPAAPGAPPAASGRVPPLPLDGWAAVAPAAAPLAAWLACGPKPPGAAFWVPAPNLSVRIDGAAITPGLSRESFSRLDVRIEGGRACVAGILAGDFTAPSATGRAPPVRFVVADLAGKRAEGEELGPGDRLRPLRCALVPASTSR